MLKDHLRKDPVLSHKAANPRKPGKQTNPEGKEHIVRAYSCLQAGSEERVLIFKKGRSKPHPAASANYQAAYVFSQNFPRALYSSSSSMIQAALVSNGRINV